jgi:hypothetical protein
VCSLQPAIYTFGFVDVPLHFAAMSNPSISMDIPRRCQSCGRGLAPDEQVCEGCALAASARSASRLSRRTIAIAAVVAALEMAAGWWFLFMHH